MSFPLDLDEYETTRLEGELKRRNAAAKKGECHYCNQPLKSEPKCRLTWAHMGRKGWYEE